MGKVVRFSASIEADLFERFEEASRRRGYSNRSEALRDVIRDSLVREEWEGDHEIVGTVTLVYDHHARELSDRLTHLQHDHHDVILSALHVHLDHDNCLEVIAVKGRASEVQAIGDALVGTRGVKHGRLTATTTGKRLR
ncbi:MAG: nickel-responsive transcriptional regulator NikR [Deltaproteobacteria bacterium]|nr:nickel-responsive transcriptional regulator NikR [Deltaproteobacteria bacterium]